MSVKTDVLICGSGSAGLAAAVWLARMGIDFRIIEKRAGPLRVGQADGVQCRTVEIFESLGLDHELTKDAFWVSEQTFWTTDDNGDIHRTRRMPDVLPGMSWKHHVIMSQAHLNNLLIRDIVEHCSRSVDYNIALRDVSVDKGVLEEQDAYPVTAFAQDERTSETVTYHAKYLIGSDGAHSSVRKSLGFQMVGDTSDAVWGVMDAYPHTNYPDIRKKANIRSKAGNLLIIPRERREMVRFYTQLPAGTAPKSVRLEDLQQAAKKIFSQYELEFPKEPYWWSAYSIGQRLADHFSKDNRIFLAGDACHTHSPKAGQGMNTSLADGYNLGWKLAYVLKGYCTSDLLKTYNSEREPTAADLIAFDRQQTGLLKAESRNGDQGAMQKYSDFFIKSARFFAGLATTYTDSAILNAKGSDQQLARNVTLGTRFPSHQVVRVCDARAMQLSKALLSDGRWRILVFPGDISTEESPITTHTPRRVSPDSVIEPLLILAGDRIELEDSEFAPPNVFAPVTGEYGMRDINKVFIDDVSYNYGDGHAYENLGIDPDTGAVIVVRPDTHVAMITSLSDFDGLRRFFGGFLNVQQ